LKWNFEAKAFCSNNSIWSKSTAHIITHTCVSFKNYDANEAQWLALLVVLSMFLNVSFCKLFLLLTSFILFVTIRLYLKTA
jgi:hypothetical protein